MRGDRAHADAAPSRDRSQTTQDFVLGIGIFLLAVAFVFAFVPSVITPYAADGGGGAATAERIANDVLDETATGEAPNEIDANAFDDAGWTATTVDAVNVSVVSLDGGEILLDVADDDAYDDQPGASVSRIVTVEGASDCDPACRLVVRVW